MNEYPFKDEDLVDLARKGHKEAFSRLISRYEKITFRLALRIIGRRDISVMTQLLENQAKV